MKIIPLTRGYFTKVDDEDYEKFMVYRWCATVVIKRNGFKYVRAMRRERPSGKTIYLHRLIVNAPFDKQVDHINGDSLDNRKSNLRFCSLQENRWNQGLRNGNTSGFRGVYFMKRDNVWVAQIGKDKKIKYLGRFNSPEKAAEKYNYIAKEYFGEFARLNIT